MELEYKGGNTLVIKTKNTALVVDPRLSLAGLKDSTFKANVQLATQERFALAADILTLDGPGEYEVANVSIVGIPARVHSDTPDQGNNATMYKIATNDITIAVVGHVASPLTDEQLEAFGVIDIAVVPVGGNGYTFDAHSAVQVVRQLDPRIVIPTHYADSDLTYEVEQMDLEPFVKELGAAREDMPKLKVRGGSVPDTLSLYVLSRTS